MNLERNWRQYNYTREISTLLTSLHRPSRKQISKKTMKLNDILNKICLMDIEHCIQKQNTNSQKHMGTLSRTDDISGHKPNLTKFKKTEIMSSTFSDYSAMKLEHNHKKKKIALCISMNVNQIACWSFPHMYIIKPLHFTIETNIFTCQL